MQSTVQCLPTTVNGNILDTCSAAQDLLTNEASIRREEQCMAKD